MNTACCVIKTSFPTSAVVVQQQTETFVRLDGTAQKKEKTQDGIMGWLHLLDIKSIKQPMPWSRVDSHAGPLLPSWPSEAHHTPNTQRWRWGRGNGGGGCGYWRPYRGFWPVNMRNPSYSRAGRVWLTVVQYWLVKGLDRRLTLGRLKAWSKGLVLKVMFMQFSAERNTGIQHTKEHFNTAPQNTHTQLSTHMDGKRAEPSRRVGCASLPETLRDTWRREGLD